MVRIRRSEQRRASRSGDFQSPLFWSAVSNRLSVKLFMIQRNSRSTLPTKEKPDLTKKVHEVPHKPGVYLMRDRFNRVIYVGKARDLRKRVGSYFMPSKMARPTSRRARCSRRSGISKPTPCRASRSRSCSKAS